MSVTVKSIRWFVASVSASSLCAVALGLTLSACGGQPEVVQGPKPVEVVWGKHEESSEPEAPAAPSGSHRAEVDLDAPADGNSTTSDESAPAAASAAAEPSPEPAAEAPVPEPPRVAEPRAEPALDKELRAAVTKGSAGKKSAPKKSATKKPAPKQASTKKSAPVASTYSGPNACQAAHFSVPRVRDACATGGRAAAKAVMRDAISKALASGASLKCANCHADQQDYTLRPDAVAQLQRWLAP